MANPDNPAALYADLRRLAAENPREARARFAQLFDADADSLPGILKLASGIEEGRLRQLVANTIKKRTDRARFAPYLTRWMAIETDEFAKAAISAALAGIELTSVTSAKPADLPDIVETYRYVADRLCHRVRNSLTGPAQHLRKLEAILNGASDPKTVEARQAVANLKDTLRALSRIVEFNIDDNYFETCPIDLPSWLKAMTADYVAKNNPLTLRLTGVVESIPLRIHGNRFLLDTLFWNLWKNAQQAVGSLCEITVQVSIVGSEIQLIVSDNGTGFTAEDAESAFEDQFRRRGSNYGRGLLEVNDAVRRLAGRVKLIERSNNEYRVQLNFPLITP